MSANELLPWPTVGPDTEELFDTVTGTVGAGTKLGDICG